MSILEISNIKKSFGNNNVLKGISFSLEEGEVLSVIGSSGSGKTTLLRCLNFLETADEGVRLTVMLSLTPPIRKSFPKRK